MIYWISGVACSGKSTLIKSILNKYTDFPNSYEIYIPIKNISCIKFNDFLLIGSNYLSNKIKKQTNLGIDNCRSNHKEIKEIIIQEYTKHNNILLETFISRYFKEELLLWLIKLYELKILHLQVDKNILDKRGEERNCDVDKLRNEEIKINQLKRVESIIKHNKIKQYVSILHNKDKKDLSNNVKLIYDYLTMKDY